MKAPSDPKARRTSGRCARLAATLIACASAGVAAETDLYLPVAGGEFSSALPSGARSADSQRAVRVPAFLMQRRPVTNRDFLSFVQAHPEWRRGTVPQLLADSDYLGHWSGPLDPAPASGAEPVTRVSWFAAEAYCEAQQARLPRWYEWELAAAAGADRADARADPAWRQQILDWYAQPGSPLRPVALRTPNFYGLHDLHGLVWEWVEDFNSLLPADADPEKFCGSGAENLQQKENYAVLMRIAMLGSLHAADTGRSLGFRCVRDAPGVP